MANESTSFTAVALIAAMITPALLILASASLVASVLVRMARVVDRARALISVANERAWARIGVTPGTLVTWLDRHALRARYTERAIALFYAAVVVFIATCLSIALDRVARDAIEWLPVVLAVLGTLFLLAGGTFMVVGSRLAGTQIAEEIRAAIHQIKDSDARSI
jgi:hypothetical protein